MVLDEFSHFDYVEVIVTGRSFIWQRLLYRDGIKEMKEIKKVDMRKKVKRCEVRRERGLLDRGTQAI